MFSTKEEERGRNALCPPDPTLRIHLLNLFRLCAFAFDPFPAQTLTRANKGIERVLGRTAHLLRLVNLDAQLGSHGRCRRPRHRLRLNVAHRRSEIDLNVRVDDVDAGSVSRDRLHDQKGQADVLVRDLDDVANGQDSVVRQGLLEHGFLVGQLEEGDFLRLQLDELAFGQSAALDANGSVLAKVERVHHPLREVDLTRWCGEFEDAGVGPFALVVRVDELERPGSFDIHSG